MKTWAEIHIKSWIDFQEKIEELKLETDYLSHWVFRGQTNSSWTLKPSILRLLESHGIDRELGNKFEITILREFSAKAHMFENFKTRKFAEGNILLNLTLMQHYGTPTRLLDWSTSPLVALYFAVNCDFSNDGSIYMFNQTILNKIYNDRKYLNDEFSIFETEDTDWVNTFMAGFESNRSNSQQGIYSFAANIDKDHADLISNALHLENEIGKVCFCKFVISKELKIEFLSRLRKSNLKSDILFPDIYGFSNSLRDLLEIRGWEFNLSNKNIL